MATEAPEDKKSQRQTTVIVNGREKRVAGETITFEQVIALAFEAPPTGPNVLFTVTYRKGHGNKPEGSLVAGQEIKLKEGEIFNVTATDKS